MGQKSAVIFCSANEGLDPAYNEAARRVVRELCERGYAIVSGGTTKGTMRVVADEAAACGAPNIGVVPRFMEEVHYPGLTRLVWTERMSERKDLMRELGADLAVALPGGVGTLDELFETLTLAKLGKYHGRIVACNVCGFYDRLRDLLDYYVEQGVLDAASRALIAFPEDLDQLRKLL